VIAGIIGFVFARIFAEPVIKPGDRLRVRP